MPVRIYGKGQVKIAGAWKSQRLLDQDLPRGGGEEVRAAHHVGDALFGIVDGDGELVGVKAVASSQHERAHRLCHVGTSQAEAPVVELDDSVRNPQPDRACASGGRVGADGGVKKLVSLFVRGSAHCGELAAAAAAVQRQSELPEPIECCVIVRRTRALAQHGAVPLEPESIQIGENSLCRTGLLTRRVEILDPHQPAATARTGFEVAADGRE
jgi:hypothetical protein